MIATATSVDDYRPTPFDPAGKPSLADLALIWDADLPDWQADLCLTSPVFMALIRAGLGRKSAGDLVSLANLWEAAGSPEGREPVNILGTWRDAVGYACDLDPARLDRSVVGRMA